jgi:fructose-1,6-bisphosphatase I
VGQLIELEGYLRAAGDGDALRGDAGRAVLAIAEAGRRIAGLLAAGPLAGDLAALRSAEHFGDTQKELDLRADALVLDALRLSGVVGVAASEERDGALILDPAAPLAVAVDPLDGSGNIDAAASMGTVFAVLPARGADSFAQPGARQVAAGFLLYGAQTALVVTLGDGTRAFTLDPASGRFLGRAETLRVPAETGEYAVNGSNWRHWDAAVRSYVSHCQMGTAGPRGRDFNTRWLGAMVGEAYRILARGGVYLYPGDVRPGYEQGRLRLVYEANPIAMLVEQAGGLATDGRQRILDLEPRSLHQRVPLVFGSAREVECVRACYEKHATEISPLFGTRTLFRTGTSAFGTAAPGVAFPCR